MIPKKRPAFVIQSLTYHFYISGDFRVCESLGGDPSTACQTSGITGFCTIDLDGDDGETTYLTSRSWPVSVLSA